MITSCLGVGYVGYSMLLASCRKHCEGLSCKVGPLSQPLATPKARRRRPHVELAAQARSRASSTSVHAKQDALEHMPSK